VLKIYAALLLYVLCSTLELRAGDAVAVGYNRDGVWTAVTYYCSSTPPGGSDYKNSSQAREAALRDLRRRGDAVAKTEILAASDSTGYFAVARAKGAGGKDVIVVGSGKSEREAEKQAFQQLERSGAKDKPTVMYRYFSNGSDTTQPLKPEALLRGGNSGLVSTRE
jgi:hypothetical protein